MLVQLKGTFNKKEHAKQTYLRLKEVLRGTNSKIEYNTVSLNSKKHNKNFLKIKDLMPKILGYTILGVAIGGITTFTLDNFYRVVDLESSMYAALLFSFAIAGLLLGFTLYFVERENNVQLSFRDLTSEKVILTVNCEKDQVPDVENTFKLYDAQKVYLN